MAKRFTSKWGPATLITPDYAVCRSGRSEWLLLDTATDATLMGPWGGVFPTKTAALEEANRRIASDERVAGVTRTIYELTGADVGDAYDLLAGEEGWPRWDALSEGEKESYVQRVETALMNSTMPEVVSEVMDAVFRRDSEGRDRCSQ